MKAKPETLFTTKLIQYGFPSALEEASLTSGGRAEGFDHDAHHEAVSAQLQALEVGPSVIGLLGLGRFQAMWLSKPNSCLVFYTFQSEGYILVTFYVL